MTLTDALAVIDDIYDLASSREDWARVLKGISELCEAGSASLAMAGSEGVSIMCSATDPALLEEYQAHWFERDPTLGANVAAPPGRVMTLGDSIGRAGFARSEMYAGFWSRTGLGMEHLRAALIAAPDAWASFGLNARREVDEVTPEMSRAFGLFLPHLTRAAQIRRRLRQAEAGRVMSYAEGRPGALVVNAESVVLAMEHAAEALVERGAGGLRLDKGVLTADAPSTAARIAELVASCRNPGRDLAPAGGTIHLPGPIPIRLEVMPVPGAAVPFGLDIMHDPRPSALVLIDDPTWAARRIRARLAGAYGLSPAEARVAAELMDGAGPEAAASRLGIPPDAMGRHISSMLEKTGARRQEDLAALFGAARRIP